MLSVERRSRIADLLREKQMVTVHELIETFAVSDMTIRRDLDVLERQGVLKKVYGGAVLASGGLGVQQDIRLAVRATSFPNRKQEIATKALEWIDPDEAIILDSGTTTLELARIIPNHHDLVIVTNSIPIAHELADKQVSLLLAGGIIISSTHSAVGPKTKDFFSDIRVRKVFLGASSLSLKTGLMNSNLYESEVKRTMIASAEQVIVLADSSKFDNKSYHVFAEWKEVDVLITDHLLPEPVEQQLLEQGIQVIKGEQPQLE